MSMACRQWPASCIWERAVNMKAATIMATTDTETMNTIASRHRSEIAGRNCDGACWHRQKQKAVRSDRLFANSAFALPCNFFQLFLIYVKIGIHVLNIVSVFQRFQQADHLV